jgi:hypothetical protein
MSLHAYSRIWLHLVWTTLNRERMLNKAAAAKLSGFLGQYAEEFRMLVEKYGLQWRDEETVETVSHASDVPFTALKRGANERLQA